MRLYINATQKQWFAASFLTVLYILMFGMFPDMLYGSLTDLPIPLNYLLPFFCAITLFLQLFSLKIYNGTVTLVLKLLMTLGCVFWMIYTVELLTGGNIKLLAIENFGAFLFTTLLLAALVAILYAITGSMPWAVRGIMFLVLIFSLVSYFVYEFRGTVFIPQDIVAVQTAAAVVSGYKFAFSQPLAEGILVCICIFFVSGKLKMAKMKRPKFVIVRSFSVFFASLFLYTLINEVTFYNFGWTPEYWDQKVTAERNGSLINFIANVPDMIFSEPDGYSVKEVNEIAANYQSDAASDADIKPDVILVMGESWSEIGTTDLVETNTPAAPFMNSLADGENSLYSDLIVSTYGGGTSRSEFQMLTGTNVEYGMHHAPFQFGMHDSVPSIVSSFEALGYDTTALHTGELDAWGRDKALPQLGFDAFYAREEIEKTENDYVRHHLSDKALYNKVLSVLDESEEPQFVYAITIQSHGGYEDEEYQSGVDILNPEGNYGKTEQFLGLMNDSDQHFEYLIEQLMKRDRPTIVLAYGDHLPMVDTAYVNYIQEKYGDSEEGAQAFNLWKHETFYVMWANYELPQEVRDTASDTLSLNYLAPQLMRSAGLPLTGYQKFLLDCMEEYPVTAPVGFINNAGKYSTAYDARTQDLYQQQAILQYNLIFDPKNYPDNFYYLE